MSSVGIFGIDGDSCARGIHNHPGLLRGCICAIARFRPLLSWDPGTGMARFSFMSSSASFEARFSSYIRASVRLSSLLRWDFFFVLLAFDRLG